MRRAASASSVSVRARRGLKHNELAFARVRSSFVHTHIGLQPLLTFDCHFGLVAVVGNADEQKGGEHAQLRLPVTHNLNRLCWSHDARSVLRVCVFVAVRLSRCLCVCREALARDPAREVRVLLPEAGSGPASRATSTSAAAAAVRSKL